MKNNWIKNNIKIDTLPEFRKVVSIKKKIKKVTTSIKFVNHPQAKDLWACKSPG